MNSFAPRTNGETAAGDVDVGAAAQRSSNSPSTGGSSDTDLTAPDVDAPIPGSKHATLNGYGNGNGTPSAVPTLGLVSDLWHAHLEPLDPSTPSRCQQSSPAEHQAWDRFVSIKPTLNLALRKPHSSLSCLRAPPWYNSGSLPSPSAIYLWRSDLAAQFDLLPMGSAAEMLCFKFLVRTKWDRGLQDRIIFGQHLEEQRRNRHKALLRRRTGRSASSSPERAPVLGIFTGVAEAESEHRSPSASRSEDGSQASASSSQQQQQGEEQQEEEVCASKNRKAFPTEFYLERSRFQDQWDKWCRMHGTNPQNELYDFAGFASHNPHSMYHKVKYGEWGSPHPYVPFAITNPAEFQASRKDQEAQESAALLWLAQRRNIASTQRQLDAHAAALRASSSNGSGAGASASAAGTAVSVANPPTVSVAVPDEEVIDQELEQPQAMGRQAVKDAVKPVAPASQQQPQPPAGIAAATSHTNPITVSVLIPDNLMPWIREHVYAQLVGRVDPALLAYWCNEDERRLPWPGKAKEEEEQDQSASARRSGLPARIPPVVNIAAVVTDDELPWRSPDLHGPSFRYPGDEEYAASRSLAGPASGARWSTRRAASHPPAPASFKIGNLFLSSCPGKKVRLTGAVRGRGAVCRDLGVDLKRFKELGVGTLVCCLSDAELGVIGVRWEEYVREADALGVDLVRVPMVEGNCPTSTSSLSHWLDEIITHCTLKGINVLVHCRGGVGRAGLVAACWLIKMGFVDEHRPISECAIRGSMWPEAEMMWQALQVVRLRRSSKAIETAEQAEYISHFARHVLDQVEQSRGDGAGVGDLSLSRQHCALVDEYWKRMRLETNLWLQREAARDGSEAGGGGGEDAVDTPPPHSAAAGATNGHHSNINSRHAAKVVQPAATATITAPRLATANKEEQSAPPAGAGGEVCREEDRRERAATIERDDDGQATRKRRNTVSSSPSSAAIANGTVVAAAQGGLGQREPDEMELDALPVGGRQE